MLQKDAVDISFAQGLDTKTDPKRVQLGKFVRLENTVFNKSGLLQKRNGYASLSSLPSTDYSYLTTFTDNLSAVGQNIAAYNDSNNTWVQKGNIQPLSVDTMPLIRNNLNQTMCDAVIAENGLICTVYLESDGSVTTAKYAIADSDTGQNIVAPSVIPVGSGTVTGGLRVFYVGTNFIIVFTNVITAVSHLQYVSVNSVNPTVVGTNTDIAASYIPASTLAWDGVVVNDTLFVAYNTTSGGQSVVVKYLTNSLSLSSAKVFSGQIGTMFTLTADITIPSDPIICVSYYDAAGSTGYTLAVNSHLDTIRAPTQIISTGTIKNLVSLSQNGLCAVGYEVANNYSFAPGTGTPTNYIASVTVTISSGAVSSPVIIIRSVGLASKAFVYQGVIYFLAAYQSSYQPTYFLINASISRSSAPVIASKLAYSNGGGYLTLGLPSITLIDNVASTPYLIKDLIQAVNKNTAVRTGTQTAGIYSQTGINLARFALGTEELYTAEIGNDLYITGGFLWMYDGYLPVEHNFFLYPDVGPTTAGSPINTAVAAWSATGGSIAAQPDGSTNTLAYYYVATYEWTDNQGNAFRSSPSIPVAVTTSGSGTAGSIVVKIPTLRLTMKVANPVKIVIYRWSIAQQNYYQVTSITSPLLNSTTTDSVSFTDTLADATILGNNILYTTGGVIGDMNGPGGHAMALFDTRLWVLDPEDKNLLWYSKQVIEATPVEMSELFTIYVPPSTATQGTTGDIRATFPMDDKLIICKKNALLYINGIGPDNTGANNQYSDPIFITSTVGCENQRSIVLTPNGLMMQTNKGIWLLGRGLETTYIGDDVEDFTQGATVTSAVLVPDTTQVRFTLDTGITLMYDYYYDQWGTFKGVGAISSCIFEGMHTYLNEAGSVYQERPGYYQDGTNPTLIALKTGPLRLGDLQNYQRAYFFYILGEYISPHRLYIRLYFDYEHAASQSIVISPVNYSSAMGVAPSQSPYGQGSPFGGPSSLEDWRVFLDRQRCMAFAIEIDEIYDPSFGVPPGAGLTMSGLNVVMGFKKGFRPQSARTSVG